MIGSDAPQRAGQREQASKPSGTVRHRPTRSDVRMAVNNVIANPPFLNVMLYWDHYRSSR